MNKKFIIGLNYDDIRYFLKRNPEYEYLFKKEQLIDTVNPHVILSSKAFRRNDIRELMAFLKTRMQ